MQSLRAGCILDTGREGANKRSYQFFLVAGVGEESGVENGTKETRGCQGDPRSQLPEVATGGRHRTMKTTRELP